MILSFGMGLIYGDCYKTNYKTTIYAFDNYPKH